MNGQVEQQRMNSEGWVTRCLPVVRVAAFGVAGLTAACGDGTQGAGAGAVTVLLESEDAIIDGLTPGDEVENIADGWAVTFNTYLATVGHIALRYATASDVTAEEEDSYVVELTSVPSAGTELWSLGDLAEGRWNFFYQTPGAAGALRDDSADEQRYEEMQDQGWTYYIAGVLTQAGGQSCPPAALAEPGDKASNGNTSGGNDCFDAPEVRFAFGAEAGTQYGPCEIDGSSGVAVTDGETRTVAVTLHGDHLFFNGFPESGEQRVLRLAQWLADCDLDLDGTVTAAELERIELADLPEFDDRFQLGGSPLEPLDSVYTYVRAQLKTQGHFQGEGECAVDGVNEH